MMMVATRWRELSKCLDFESLRYLSPIVYLPQWFKQEVNVYVDFHFRFSLWYC